MKIILLSLSLFFVTLSSFSQKTHLPKGIIPDGVGIRKYHSKSELDRMQKGELLVLYSERIKSLIKLLPYLAFTTRPGITMTSLGIPNDGNNKKVLNKQFDATDSFLESNDEFLKKILPYSDTRNLISAILFYEETMKTLHEFGEYD